MNLSNKRAVAVLKNYADAEGYSTQDVFIKVWQKKLKWDASVENTFHGLVSHRLPSGLSLTGGIRRATSVKSKNRPTAFDSTEPHRCYGDSDLTTERGMWAYVYGVHSPISTTLMDPGHVVD